MKLRFRYFYYEMKRVFRYIPQMLIGAIVLAAMAGTIAFCAVRIFSASGSRPSVPVAIVSGDDTGTMSIVIDFIQDMESVRDNFRFLIMDEQEATEALESGTVGAVMILPDRLIEGIMDGTNRHIQVILSDSDAFSAVLLQELATAGAKTLSSAQAGTYTMTELFRDAGIGNELSSAYEELDIRNFRYAIVREDLFRTVNSNPTGNVSAGVYYLSSGILFFLLMVGMCYGGFYEKSAPAMTLKMNSARIGSLTECIVHYLTILFCHLFYYLLFALSLLFCVRRDVLEPSACSKLLLLAFILVTAISAYLFFILEAAPTAASSIVLLFIVTMLLMLLSGCFIPASFLPESLLPLAPMLPTGSFMHQLFHISGYFTGTAYQYPVLFDRTCRILILYSCIFFAAACILHRIRRSRT